MEFEFSMLSGSLTESMNGPDEGQPAKVTNRGMGDESLETGFRTGYISAQCNH